MILHIQLKPVLDKTCNFFTNFLATQIPKLILSTAFLVLSIHFNNSFAQDPIETTELAISQKTAGTFQIEWPTDKKIYWRIDVIESLYPEIESRRSLTEHVIWNYSEDVRIIIFSREFINDEYFIPLESPYKGLKEY